MTTSPRLSPTSSHPRTPRRNVRRSSPPGIPSSCSSRSGGTCRSRRCSRSSRTPADSWSPRCSADLNCTQRISRVVAVNQMKKINAVLGFTRLDEMDRVNDLVSRLVKLTRNGRPDVGTGHRGPRRRDLPPARPRRGRRRGSSTSSRYGAVGCPPRGAPAQLLSPLLRDRQARRPRHPPARAPVLAAAHAVPRADPRDGDVVRLRRCQPHRTHLRMVGVPAARGRGRASDLHHGIGQRRHAWWAGCTLRAGPASGAGGLRAATRVAVLIGSSLCDANSQRPGGLPARGGMPLLLVRIGDLVREGQPLPRPALPAHPPDADGHPCPGSSGASMSSDPLLRSASTSPRAKPRASPCSSRRGNTPRMLCGRSAPPVVSEPQSCCSSGTRPHRRGAIGGGAAGDRRRQVGPPRPRPRVDDARQRSHGRSPHRRVPRSRGGRARLCHLRDLQLLDDLEDVDCAQGCSEQPGVVVTVYVDADKADPPGVKAQLPRATVYRSATCPTEGRRQPRQVHRHRPRNPAADQRELLLQRRESQRRVRPAHPRQRPC